MSDARNHPCADAGSDLICAAGWARTDPTCRRLPAIRPPRALGLVLTSQATAAQLLEVEDRVVALFERIAAARGVLPARGGIGLPGG